MNWRDEALGFALGMWLGAAAVCAFFHC